jgi:arylsulfatase A-like enzyme
MQKLLGRSLVAMTMIVATFSGFAAGKAAHVVVVVWDGMRPDFISQEHTPTLYRLAHEGVMFENHHAVYCSATEVNGTAIATGTYPEHSGIIANRDYLPQIEPLKPVDIQSFANVRQGDALTGGNYVLRPTLVEILLRAGKSTAIAGTKEVALLHDRKDHASETLPPSVTLFEGKTIPTSTLRSIEQLLGDFPTNVLVSSIAPNFPRDDWTTRALLGPIWSNSVPAFSLLWLSEPDFSQHAKGLGSPKALAALESSDKNLAAVLAELDRRGLRDQTDIFVVSDHGFSTVEKSVDVCKTLQAGGFAAYREFKSVPKKDDILLSGQGGSVLFYIIGQDTQTAGKLVKFLQQQDFSGVLFTRAKFPGAFRLEDVKINSPHAPDVILSLRWTTNKSSIGVPGTLYGDGIRNAGQGLHASLSRFDMHNTLVASGPDLKKGFADTLPTGNTDLAPTILWLLGVKPIVAMDGRILSEALNIHAPKAAKLRTDQIETQCTIDQSVWHQYLQISRVNRTVYFDQGNGELIAK